MDADAKARELFDELHPHFQYGRHTEAIAAIAAALREVEQQARREERERCARVADNHWFIRDIEWWMTTTKKDVSAEACRSVAAAIRALVDERRAEPQP